MRHTALILAWIITFVLSSFAMQNKAEQPNEFDNYQDSWLRIESFEKVGQPKSALAEVELILSQAKKEVNSPQLIKALLHQFKYKMVLEEDAELKIIRALNEEIGSTGDIPARSILHSLMAETYWQYYQNNRYRFLNRTSVVEVDKTDFRTWDLQSMFDEIRSHYWSSLESPEILMGQPIGNYDAILLQQDESELYRPTLYDLLAHRLLDFMAHGESGLTEPVNQFVLDDPRYYVARNEFAKLKIPESSSNHTAVLLVLQDLISFKSSDANPEELLDIDLKRYGYLQQHSLLDNKGQLYTEALDALSKEFPKSDYTAYVLYKLAEFKFNNSHDFVVETDNEANPRIEAVRICNSTIAKYPKSFGAENCRALLQRIERKQLGLQAENVILPEQKSKVLLTYTNISEVWFRIVKADRTELNNQRRGYYDRDKWIKGFINRKPHAEWSTKVTDPEDYYQHTTEIPVEGLEKGSYFIFASYDPSFGSNVSVAETIWSSSISYLTRKDDKGSLEVYVADRKTSHPIEQAKVQPYHYVYDYDSRKQKRVDLPLQYSDRNGFLRIDQPNTERSGQIGFEISYKDDFLNEGNDHYLNRPHERQRRWSQQVHFFTDRSIYRPGQLIYFKGILTETNGEETKILANTSADIVFRDVNYKEIGKLTLQSNEFGSFHGSFNAPTGGLMGRMTIQGPGGQANLQVEEYKRPTFEVILDTLEGSYSLDEDVTVTGKAVSYAGAALQDAAVKYRVVRQVRYPWWGWGYYRRGPVASNSKEIAHGEAATGQDGSFKIIFNAEPDRSVSRDDKPQFRYTVYVDIVDLSGETRSGEKNVNLGYVGLNLNLDYNKDWNRDKTGTIVVSTTNLDGKSESANVVLNLYKFDDRNNLLNQRRWNEPDLPALSEKEHKRLFPYDIYSETSPEDRSKTLIKTFNINTGISESIELTPLLISGSGEYWLEAEAKDDGGNTIEAKSYFKATSASDTKPVSPVHLNLTADKVSYEPGDLAVVKLATSIQDAFVIIKITHDGSVLETKYLRVSDEIKAIPVTVEEKYRGGLQVHAAVISRNRNYVEQLTLDVPFESRDLQVEWTTFRDLLKPGQQEEWRLTIKGPKGDKVGSELLAAMYDKSLDYFLPHNYHFNAGNMPFIKRSQAFDPAGNFRAKQAWIWKHKGSDVQHSINAPLYDQLNMFGFYMNGYRFKGDMMMASESMDEIQVRGNGAPKKAMAMERDEAAPAAGGFGFADGEAENAAYDGDDQTESQMEEPKEDKPEANISLRSNLQETAFFYPQLTTNEAGEFVIKFTAPEALTTWNFMGMAHDKDLKYKIFSKEVKTQKELMVTPHFPRFFREDDKISVTAKIDNLTNKELNGRVILELKDALTGKVITGRLIEGNQHDIVIDANGNKVVTWDIHLLYSYQAITYEIYATAGDFTDGVTGTVPVLTNRMMVTETMPVWLKGAGERSFTLDHLKNYSSETLKHHQYTLEYASNPAWYAVQALPYLMEFPYECAEQLFSRYYANTLASHIANSNPRIRQIFEQWKNADSDALISNLEKNQELKALLIEETPWLRDAEDESERKKRIALLFDLNRMANERSTILKKLRQMQTPNGGFSWFPGMRDNRYITQHILTGLAHLQQLDVSHGSESDVIRSIIDKAIPYLDARIREDLRDIKKYDKDWKKNDHLGSIQIQYLYVRAHFRDYLIDGKSKEAFDYFLGQTETFWIKKSMYDQAMISIALHHYFKKETAMQIITSLDEQSIVSDEMGMYWKAIEQGGFYWYNAPIESHAMMIEAFHIVADDDDAVNELKVWLLKQKQVQDWKTTKATAEAVFALLLRGDDWLANTTPAIIKVAGEIVDVKSMDATYEAGTGYFKVKWDGSQVEKKMAEIEVSSQTDAPSWGAVYWQYFEDLDKIETFEETPLQLKKQLFLESNTDEGPQISSVDEKTSLKPGDKLKVRIELRVDRNMEFVHMKDMRASGLEPVNVLSQYKYQDGLGYYESTRDAATHFFFDYLPKGVYVFEYPLRVSHAGDFSNGITTIQSMYAPEFASHSEGVRVTISER
ncbi:MAG: hypothetical protein GY751_16605 [Bacteroidetes bacterium]|nr:hypothetical protein [Bacteroidota bacterium]